MSTIGNFLLAVCCYQLGLLFVPSIWTIIFLEAWFIFSTLYWFFSASHRWPEPVYTRMMYTVMLPLGLVLVLGHYFETGKLRFK